MDLEKIKQRCFSWMMKCSLEFDKDTCVVQTEEQPLSRNVVVKVTYDWQSGKPNKWVEGTLTPDGDNDEFKIFHRYSFQSTAFFISDDGIGDSAKTSDKIPYE